MSSYGETIERLKRELKSHVAMLKSRDEWDQVEKLYQALRAIEDLAGAPKTTLKELFGLIGPGAQATAKHAEKIPELALGNQQEPESATEIEKGA